MMIVLIASCEKAAEVPQNSSPIRANFVSGCLKAAASETAKVQQICECVYDQSEKAYGNPAEWEKVVQQFNDTEIRDEKLNNAVRQATAQCKK